MNFNELAKSRFSCRKFDSRNVEKDKIDLIIEAALAAPTAVNRQPQRILVIDDKELLANLKECTKYTFDAPLCFAVCAHTETAYKRGYDGKCSAEIDASIVTTHMMLQAADIGLGTTWVMAFDPAKAREILKIPNEFEIVALLPTGYPADDAPINPLHYKSAEADKLVAYNKFN